MKTYLEENKRLVVELATYVKFNLVSKITKIDLENIKYLKSTWPCLGHGITTKDILVKASKDSFDNIRAESGKTILISGFTSFFSTLGIPLAIYSMTETLEKIGIIFIFINETYTGNDKRDITFGFHEDDTIKGGLRDDVVAVTTFQWGYRMIPLLSNEPGEAVYMGYYFERYAIKGNGDNHFVAGGVK